VASYLKEQTTCPKGYWYDGAECVKEADYQPFTFEIVPNSFTINADQSSATIISNLSKFVNQSTTQSIEFSLLHQTNTQNIQCSIEDVRITCAIQENENSNTLVQILANDSKTALNQTINVSSLFVAPQSQNQPTQNTFTGGTRTTQTNVGDVFVVQEEEPAQEFTQNTTTQETEQPEEPSLEVETPFGPGNQTEDEPDNLITGQITGPLGAQAITIASIFIGLLLIVSIILIVIFMRKN
ncbi:MAG: hypothetical protein ACMXYF_06060, partial [Candidatus Woesearchaeota archaeon]